MKVLAFSCYYTPEIAASMYLTEDIYKGIVDAGHTLEVYVPMPTRGIDDETRKKYKNIKEEKKYCNKLTIHRIPMFKEGKTIIFRALRYVLIDILFFIYGLRTEADILFIQSTPPIQGVMAGVLSKMKGIPLVYNLQDVFPDSMVNSGITAKDSILWKIGRVIEDFSYDRSSKIIVISVDFKKNIMAKGVPEGKIEVVPNWADTGGVYPIKREDNVLIKRYALDPSKFYITYAGNIGLTQNMDLLLDAAKTIRNRLPILSFLIIGDGADKSRVCNRIENEEIDNVIMIPFQPYEDIAHVYSIGDVGLIISKPGVGKNSVPSKTWSIMAAGKPILASFDKDSDLSLLIKKAECGFVADAGSKEELIEGIVTMYTKTQERERMANNSAYYINANLSKESCVSQYIDAMNDLRVSSL